MAAPTQAPITDVINERLNLPEGKTELCSAHEDDGSKTPGQIRFILNREVLDLYGDIIDDLEMSRQLPDAAHPANIQITDPVVVFLLQNDPDIRNEPEETMAQLAREKAAGWYTKQKAQVASDAIFIAISMYNELNVVPIPYKDGEIAWSVVDGEEGARSRARSLPSWLAEKAHYEIPLPERRLSNLYERRLKQLYQIVEACGVTWSAQFRVVYEKGIAKMVALSEPRDDRGFRTQQTNRKVPKKPRAAD